MAGGYTLSRGCGGGYRCDIGQAVFDGGFANVAVIVLAHSADRRIDHELYLAVLDGIDDVRATLVHLEDRLGFDAVVGEVFRGTLGGLDFEADLSEVFRYG